MNLRYKCSCGKRFLKKVKEPTDKQVAEEMFHGFISCNCEEHQEPEPA
jgi:hypothetical protein